MRFNYRFIVALICLNIAGCAGCGVVPIAKPWNSGTVVLQDKPCGNPSAKPMNEDHCAPQEENPIY
jgi:hypothetical protein